jgi:uncharacterized protein DUF2442
MVVWLLTGSRELFMLFEDFPWFKNEPIGKFFKVEEPTPGHFYWLELDIDVGIENPENYPLKGKIILSNRLLKTAIELNRYKSSTPNLFYVL